MMVRNVAHHPLRAGVLASAIVISAAILSALVVRRRVERLDLVSVLKTRD